MANIEKRGDTYRITVSHGFDVDGKRIRHKTTWTPDPKKTQRQNDAALRRFVDEYEHKVKDGTVLGEETTFKQFAEQWMATYGRTSLEATTRRSYSDVLRIHLLPACGHMRLSDIRVPVVRQILDGIRERGYERNGEHHTYSEETIRTVKTVFSSILAAAVEDGILALNPCAVRQRKHKQTAEPQGIKTWSIDQTLWFLEILDMDIPVIVGDKTHTRNGKPVLVHGHVNRVMRVQPRFKGLFITTVFSGCRRGELLALTWSDVNFEKNTVAIKKAAAFSPETGAYIKAPKSAAGFREIFLPPVCMDLLHQIKRQMQKDILRFGTAWEGPRKIDENLVFPSLMGGMMHHDTPRHELQRIIKAHNRAYPDHALPVLSFHQLRHTSASLLIAGGLDPVAVAQRLGHADATTTLRIYAHSFAERDKAAADALESILTPRKRKQA